MSRRWTNFIRGPNLQDQHLHSSAEPSGKSPDTTEEDGIRTKEEYEKIISQPSTSNQAIAISSLNNRRITRNVESSSKKVDSPPAPSFAYLLKLAQTNDYSRLESLLTAHTNSINLNEKDEFGWTLLMVSACAGASESVQLFLEKGADWSLTNRKGLTALALAQKKNLKEICTLLKNCQRSIDLSSDSSGSDTAPPPESSAGFCQVCAIEYQSQSRHNNSIAHLITTSNAAEARTHYGIPDSNRGFQILLKHGWDRERGLGPEGEGQKFPVKTILKRDRIGLGHEEGDKTKRARVTHFGPGDLEAVERPVKSGERLERKRTLEKKAEKKKKSKDRIKEIDLRRDLGNLS